MAATLAAPSGPLGWVALPEITIECDAFEGTLGTLVRCVLNQKVDLTEIPLSPIVGAYIEYMLAAGEDELDASATGLVALSYLIERKAYRLLPGSEPSAEEEEEPIWEGPSVLDFEPALLALRSQGDERSLIHFRQAAGQEYRFPTEVVQVDVRLLGQCLEELMARAVPTGDVVTARARRSLADQMRAVLKTLGPDPLPIDRLCLAEFTREEAVWIFLALLELIRLRQACVAISEDGQIGFYQERAA